MFRVIFLSLVTAAFGGLSPERAAEFARIKMDKKLLRDTISGSATIPPEIVDHLSTIVDRPTKLRHALANLTGEPSAYKEFLLYTALRRANQLTNPGHLDEVYRAYALAACAAVRDQSADNEVFLLHVFNELSRFFYTQTSADVRKAMIRSIEQRAGQDDYRVVAIPLLIVFGSKDRASEIFLDRARVPTRDEDLSSRAVLALRKHPSFDSLRSDPLIMSRLIEMLENGSPKLSSYAAGTIVSFSKSSVHDSGKLLPGQLLRLIKILAKQDTRDDVKSNIWNLFMFDGDVKWFKPSHDKDMRGFYLELIKIVEAHPSMKMQALKYFGVRHTSVTDAQLWLARVMMESEDLASIELAAAGLGALAQGYDYRRLDEDIVVRELLKQAESNSRNINYPRTLSLFRAIQLTKRSAPSQIYTRIQLLGLYLELAKRLAVEDSLSKLGSETHQIAEQNVQQSMATIEAIVDSDTKRGSFAVEASQLTELNRITFSATAEHVSKPHADWLLQALRRTQSKIDFESAIRVEATMRERNIPSIADRLRQQDHAKIQSLLGKKDFSQAFANLISTEGEIMIAILNEKQIVVPFEPFPLFLSLVAQLQERGESEDLVELIYRSLHARGSSGQFPLWDEDTSNALRLLRQSKNERLRQAAETFVAKLNKRPDFIQSKCQKALDKKT